MARRLAVPLLVGAQTASKLADTLSSAKTVLTWLLGALGTPAYLIALLVPIRESGSMLPQLWLAGMVKRFRHRKWAYVLGAAGQAVGAALMAAAAIFLGGNAAGYVVLAALALLALSRALSSIAAKDVLARTVDKGERGRVGGLSASISGVFGAAAALAAIFFLGARSNISDYAAVVAAAAVLFAIAGAGYAALPETPEASAGEDRRPASLRLLARDPTFRNFVLARALLLGSALGAPYIVVFAQAKDAGLRELALFMVAGASASALSSVAWGKLADRSARHAMAAGGVITCIVGAGAVALSLSQVTPELSLYIWPSVYFLFSVGYAGVRMGRKTYVVDIATGDTRTDYVAVSNTVIAALLLVFGGLGAGLSSLSNEVAFGAYLVLTAAGSLLAVMLPSVAD